MLQIAMLERKIADIWLKSHSKNFCISYVLDTRYVMIHSLGVSIYVQYCHALVYHDTAIYSTIQSSMN